MIRIGHLCSILFVLSISVGFAVAQGPEHAAPVDAPQVSAQGDRGSVDTLPVDSALTDSVWYDADEGGLVPVFVKPIVDDSLNRDSRWLPKAKRIAQPKTKTNTNTKGAQT